MKICNECSGEGKYIVRNAYRPEVKDVVACEYCGGVGVLNSSAKRKKDGPN